MRLRTFHSPAFCLLTDTVRPELSANARAFPAQYEKLWQTVDTKDFVWCVTDALPWEPRSGQVEWILEVPQPKFLRIINWMVWNGIIGRGNQRAPEVLQQRFRLEAPDFDDGESLERYVEERTRDLVYPRGDPWDSLFLEDPLDPRANILITCPVNASWVVDARRH